MFLKNARRAAAGGREIGRSACRTTSVEGHVDGVSTPSDMPDAGQVLLCRARPGGRVALDL